MARAPVYLNVYDMYWLNEYASSLGVGVFHSGIEVYGTEYAYGGHPFPFSGIFENAPKDAEELGENFKFRESILLGKTDFSVKDVRKMIQQMGLDYRGDSYHLITKNCNHFSNDLSRTLTGQELPPWINRLASISGSVPFLERWIPQEWLTPIALQQTLDTRGASNSSNHPAPTPAAAPVAKAVTNRAGMNTAAIRVGRSGSEDQSGAGSSTENGGGTNKPSTTTCLPWRFFRRNGANNSNQNNAAQGSASAPATSRQPNGDSANNLSPTLSRLWSSLKGHGNSNGNGANSSGNNNGKQ